MWMWKYLKLILINIFVLNSIMFSFGIFTVIELQQTNKKFNELIKLNIPEEINIVPENYIL